MPAADRDAAIAAHVESERISASNTDSFVEAWIIDVTGLAYDRGYCPDGVQLQTAAIPGSGDRSPHLTAVTIPTAVIHSRAAQRRMTFGQYLPTMSDAPESPITRGILAHFVTRAALHSLRA